MTSLVLLVIGPDRPGLVEILSNALGQHGARWQQSRMARLSGYFTGILDVEVPPDRVDSLSQLLRELGEQGLEVFVQRGEPEAPSEKRQVHLDLVGTDRPGIVRRISQELSRQGVNVNQLETELTEAPMSGEMLFRARAELRLPEKLDLAVLRETLEAIGSDLMVDLKLEEL